MNKLSLIWSLIGANISNQLPKYQELPVEHAYWYVFFKKRSAGMLFKQPKKYRYGIPVHTVPLRALVVVEIPATAAAFFGRTVCRVLLWRTVSSHRCGGQLFRRRQQRLPKHQQQ